MGVKYLGDARMERLKGARMKLWMIRATTMVLLWTCAVQLTALGEVFGPRVLKGWPACLLPQESQLAATSQLVVHESIPLPPKSKFCFVGIYGIPIELRFDVVGKCF